MTTSLTTFAASQVVGTAGHKQRYVVYVGPKSAYYEVFDSLYGEIVYRTIDLHRAHQVAREMEYNHLAKGV